MFSPSQHHYMDVSQTAVYTAVLWDLTQEKRKKTE